MAKIEAKKPVTRDQYEAALNNYVQSQLMLSKLAAKRDEKVQKIAAEFDTRMGDLKDSMDGSFDTVQRFCEENREELFPEIKSREEFGAKIGFREGKEKVVIMKGFKLKDIVAKLQKLTAWKSYIRQTPELDKAALIQNKPKGMDKHGLQVVQEENFFLEVEQTEVDA